MADGVFAGAARATGVATEVKEVLRVEGLTVHYPTEEGTVVALREVGFGVRAGETLAVMGESGCGKSTLGRALIGLLPRPGRMIGGAITLGGRRVDGLSQASWQPLRGREISMLFQDPMLALNPVLRVGLQLAETVRDERGVTPGAKEIRARGLAVLQSVGFDDPVRVWRSYPFQLSGGMRQRVALAIALANRPRVLVADEPTTALDVKVQAQVLDVLRRLQSEMGLALVLITHDAGVAAAMADRLAVLYAGRLAELGPAGQVLRGPSHPYTEGLLKCLPAPGAGLPQPLAGYPPSLLDPPDRCPFIPRCARADAHCLSAPFPPLTETSPGLRTACYHPLLTSDLADRSVRSPAVDHTQAPEADASGAPVTSVLRVVALSKAYRVGGLFRRSVVGAVRDVSLTVGRGEVVGLVGASGCGKSTLARCVLRLESPDGGTIQLGDVRLDQLHGAALRRQRRRMQIIFQDARGSLNPRREAQRIVREPLEYFGIGTRDSRAAQAAALLERVGLTPDVALRRPGRLSSGQCQRVAIARALAPKPDLLLCDEPVSSLDLSVQAQILQLLHALQLEQGFGMLFISHNLAVVEALAHRVLVMDAGAIVEEIDLSAGRGLAAARHPVTRELLAAIPAAVA